MRRGLLTLLMLLAGSSLAWAQNTFLASSGPTETPKVSPDAVVSRLMTFDQNHDGRVVIGELSERMRPLVERGDRNRDGALDTFEIHALADAHTAPVQQRGGTFSAGGYSFGDDVGLSSRKHIEGVLDDLRLASEKKERALPIVKAHVDMVEHAATAELISQLEPLLSPQQLTAFTAMLNAEKRRQVTIRTTTKTGEAQVLMMNGGVDLARRVDAMQLGAPNNEKARQAIERFKTRLRLGHEPDRLELLAQLQGILSAEELDDYGAALARRPVVANGIHFVAVNDAVVRSHQFIGDVVKPAVLIERGSVVAVPGR